MTSLPCPHSPVGVDAPYSVFAMVPRMMRLRDAPYLGSSVRAWVGLNSRVMPSYRRFTVPGSAIFFTVVTYQRRSFLTDPLARRCLREAFQRVRATRPFALPAIVLLPDHLHALWIRPPGDAGYSVRWRRIKEEFTERYLQHGGEERPRSASRHRRKERGLWQRRFWEHTIQDEYDFERHVDYIHYNPIKHGLATCPRDWIYSSFHSWVSRGDYPPDWGCSSRGPIHLGSLEESAWE